MTASTPVNPPSSGPDDEHLDLDAIGLAAEFAQYVRRHRIAPGDQPRALGAWLDEMIAELEADADEQPLIDDERR